MIEWAIQSELPLHLLLTKSDKLKRGAAQNTLLKISRELEVLPNVSLQLFSSLKNSGVDEARNKISSWLSVDETIDIEINKARGTKEAT